MPSHRLQVLISPSLERRLRHAAKRAGMSRAAWVRDALEAKLERDAGAATADPLAALKALNGPTADICGMIGEIEAGRS